MGNCLMALRLSHVGILVVDELLSDLGSLTEVVIQFEPLLWKGNNWPETRLLLEQWKKRPSVACRVAGS